MSFSLLFFFFFFWQGGEGLKEGRFESVIINERYVIFLWNTLFSHLPLLSFNKRNILAKMGHLVQSYHHQCSTDLITC